MIVLSDRVTATTADLLNSTRLQTVPAGGFLVFEFIADLADATNNFTVSIQMPSGDTPLNGVLVPGVNPSLAGVMDERQKMMLSLPINQGGHAVVTLTETGAAICMYRITYTGPTLPTMVARG